MKIRSAVKDYEVLFVGDAKELLPVLANNDHFYVIDQNVFELHRPLFGNIDEKRLFLLKAEEQKKNIQSVILIIEGLLSAGIKRSSTLVSIGGGITQDITGLAASVYFRGIGWIYLPTTLLAQSDSCIGGKTSLNHDAYKNVIGNFFPPDNVYVCGDFLRTLPYRDFLSGVGEIVKLFLISGKGGFEEIKRNLKKLMARNKDVVGESVRKSLSIKKEYIEEDEFDLGSRGILNFGHTAGHAIESATGYKISHGEAVVIGMDIANSISCNRGMLSADVRSDIRREVFLPLMKGSIPEEALDIKNLVSYLKRDKKKVGPDHSFILMDGDFAFAKFNDVKESEIERALGAVKI